MTDYERAIMAAEEKFFNECNTGTGKFWHCDLFQYKALDMM